MKKRFKNADPQVRTTRETARQTDPTNLGRAFDAVAYAAALEVLG